jgi:hypothetical protein
METFPHLWQYLDKFLQWEIFYTKVLEKIKTHNIYSVKFFRKSCRLWDNVKKYGARWATNDVTIWRIGVACWIRKAIGKHAHTHEGARAHTHTHTQTNVSYLLLFHGNIDLRTRLNVTLYVHCLSCFDYIFCLSQLTNTMPLAQV